jgi:class 3 adenylate cyclase/tetratricopeptide (TPR) repeat protein
LEPARSMIGTPESRPGLEQDIDSERVLRDADMPRDSEHRARHAETPTAHEPDASARELDAERVRPYVPRIFQQHLLDDPTGRSWVAEGSAAFVDISGFTQLSEQLARKGREGAEQITDAIDGSFESILLVAYRNGGSLLKFGGDGLLLWFHGEGHAARACRAAVLMRGVLQQVGRIELREAQVTLGMSQGVHSGRFHFFAVGTSHIEFLPVGPAWSRLVAMEREAGDGEIVISPETAALLESGCVGETRGFGLTLQREPPGVTAAQVPMAPPPVPPETLVRCLSPAIRAHVLEGRGTPEHRPVTVAFIRFEGTDALIEERGTEAAAEALQRLVSTVEGAAEEQNVSFLGSDVDADGGKLILTGGAPKVTGSDEERVLLALRKIVTSELPLPVRVGVHRGAVFAGDIGPRYRRTYTVMGDAVNLTARVMAKVEPGQIYATGDALDRSNTLFETHKLEPFAVKGKAEPIQAWSVGRAQGSRTRQGTQERLPLTGRNAELGVIRKVFASARSGTGRLLEIVGEGGIGKTRLLEALRDAAAGFGKQHAACEAYTTSAPYALWRELLRELMAFGRDEPDAVIIGRLRDEVAQRAPDLSPWLPLIAIAFGVDVAPTPEVEMLAGENRRARLHESVGRFLEVMLPERTLVEIENAHYMDEASAELLSYLSGELAARPWLFAVARRPSSTGFVAPETPAVARIELKPLAPQDALRMAELASQGSPLPAHVLEVVAKRSGGNPQFLRDLLRTVITSGGITDLPDSAEAAAMAQIDGLAQEDRAVVRRAAVFGLTFHPRMLAWFAEDGEEPPPGPVAWDRLRELFDEESDGYMRFRRSLLRDAAYQGLPYKLRRKLHGLVAARLEEEMDYPEEAAGTLSLHYFEAGEYRPAWRYATAAAKHAEGVYAYVEAAGLYARALEAGQRLPDLGSEELARVHQAIGDAWYRVGEFSKASAAYIAARPLVTSDPLLQADLMLKLSHMEDKLGNYAEALRWTEQARALLRGRPGPEAARLAARASAWHATILLFQGRKTEAIESAERTVAEAEAADDAEALADAYFVLGLAQAEVGRDGALQYIQRSLEAYQRAGNPVREAALLADLGVVCQAEGRWDEALSYYDRGRDAALKIGSTVSAVLARVNMAEVLTDRGEWVEAEALLLQTLPFWQASQFHFFLAACLSLLGRVALRLGRLGEALSRLEEARSNFMHVGAEDEVPAVDARIAECRLASGNPDGAIELVSGLLSRASESNGIARVVPLLERVQGHALLQQGDVWGARDALEASLASARERRNLFEAALTMLSLIELDRLEGVEPPSEMVHESRTLLSSLKVRAVPPVPLPPR